MHIFSVICIGNSGFSREYGHIFPLPEGIWKYPREFENFPRAKPEGNFQIHEGISKFTKAAGIYVHIHEKNPNFLHIFFFFSSSV